MPGCHFYARDSGPSIPLLIPAQTPAPKGWRGVGSSPTHPIASSSLVPVHDPAQAPQRSLTGPSRWHRRSWATDPAPTATPAAGVGTGMEQLL